MRIGAPVQTVQGTLLLMRSLRFAEFGPPSVLQIEEVPIPEPGEAEALVHVKAAAINPSDIADVSGRFRNTTLPRTPGRDFAGVVVKGKQHEGEEVWGSAPKLGIVRDGSHAEYVVVPAETLSPKPKSLSMAQAAAIGVPYITAWACVVNAAQIQAGETILVVGAAGAVGQAGTQIANWKQARVIGADITSDPIADRKNSASRALPHLIDPVLSRTRCPRIGSTNANRTETDCTQEKSAARLSITDRRRKGQASRWIHESCGRPSDFSGRHLPGVAGSVQ